MNRQDILQSLRSRKLISDREIDIQCENVNAISYRDILELYLFLSGVRHWRWVDKQGRVSDRQIFINSLLATVRDILSWPLVYLHVAGAVGKSEKQFRALQKSQAGASVLFLRTDHVFNVISGGSIGHINGVVHGLRAIGYRTHVISTDTLRGLADKPDFYHFEPEYMFGRNLPNIPELLYNDQLVRRIFQRWDQWQPSFIYQRYSLGNYAGVLLKQKYDIPYICEYNSSFIWVARHWLGRPLFHERLINRIELLNLRAADLIVVVSQPSKDELVMRGIDPSKILVNPNGVEPEHYSPDIDGTEIRCKYQLNGKVVIGFIGTFGPWHGTELLATAAAKLCREGNQRNLHFLFIGDGVRRAETERIIHEAGIGHCCTFSGLVSQELGPHYLAACDILVSPHVPNPDGTPFFGSPTKLFEYMAMGKGIVASNLNQIGEILTDGDTAVMVRPGDPDDLERGIRVLVENPAEAARLGRNARRAVLERYTWLQNVRRTLRALDSVQRGESVENL